MHDVHERQTGPLAVITASLQALGVHGDDVEPFLYHTALALPGWAGMFSRLERHPEDHPGGPPTTLVDFMAVRLLFERRAIAHACRLAGLPLDWTALRTLAPAGVAAARPVRGRRAPAPPATVAGRGIRRRCRRRS